MCRRCFVFAIVFANKFIAFSECLHRMCLTMYVCVGVLVRVINNMVIIITFWVTWDMKRDEWSKLNYANDPRICIANASAYLQWWQLLWAQCNFDALLERWWASIQSPIAGSDVKIPCTIFCLNVDESEGVTFNTVWRYFAVSTWIN